MSTSVLLAGTPLSHDKDGDCKDDHGCEGDPGRDTESVGVIIIVEHDRVVGEVVGLEGDDVVLVGVVDPGEVSVIIRIHDVQVGCFLVGR